jgi:hypothetical protein
MPSNAPSVPEALRRLYDRPLVTAEKRPFRTGANVCGLALFQDIIYAPLLLGFVGVLRRHCQPFVPAPLCYSAHVVS